MSDRRGWPPRLAQGVVAGVVVLGTMLLDLVLAGPAAADNCGDISDCFPSAKGILFALAAVLILVGILALLSGGPGVLAFLAAAAAESGGGGLALAGGGILTEAGVLTVSATGVVQVVAGVAAVAEGTVLLSQASDASGSSSGSSSGGSRGGDSSGSGSGANLSSRPSQIADRLRFSVREVKDAIHAVKTNMPRSGPVRNPDVMVDLETGEVYPQLEHGGVGDSIGNIFDYLPGGG